MFVYKNGWFINESGNSVFDDKIKSDSIIYYKLERISTFDDDINLLIFFENNEIKIRIKKSEAKKTIKIFDDVLIHNKEKTQVKIRKILK